MTSGIEERARGCGRCGLPLAALLRLLHRLRDGRRGSGAGARVWWPWARRGSLPTCRIRIGRIAGGARRYHRSVVSLLVQKFGGTSVADPDRIRAVAEHIVRTRRAGNDVVVVVSAMGKTTDDLERLAHEVVERARRPRDGHAAHRRASGSRSRCSAWRSSTCGEPAVSASPAPRPGSSPTPRTARRRSSRSRATGSARRSPTGNVAVVAGFQGVSTDARHHHARPRRLRHHRGRARGRARRRRLRDLHRRRGRVHRRPAHRARRAQARRGVSFDEMLEMAATGGRVLALRSVEFARNHGVPVHVRSSFTWEPGTWVARGGAEAWKQAIISGVTHDIVRGEGHDRAGARPARRRGHAVPRARRRERERRHDRAERVDRRATPTSRSPCRSDDLAAHDGGHGEDRRRDRGRRRPTPTTHIGRVSLVGAGMKTQPRRRGEDVRDARRRGRQHRDDLARRRSGSRAWCTRTTSSARCGRCTRAFELERAPDEPSARRRRRRDRPGRHRDAAHPRGARVPGRASCARTRRRAPRAASCRSRGGEVDVRGARATAASTASTSWSSTSTTRSRSSGRRRPRPRARRVVDNSAAFRMDPDVPLVVAEVNPDDLRDLPEGHRVVPELHDDGARHRARAAAPRRGHRAHGRVDVPVGVGRRAGRACTSSTSSGRSSRARRRRCAAPARIAGRRSSRARCGPKPIAGNVIPLAGSVKEAGYTSEEWKLVHESRKILHATSIRVHASRACACRCTSGTRCRPTCSSTRPMSQGRGGRAARRRAGRAARRRRRRRTRRRSRRAGIDPVLVGRLREDPSQAEHARPLGHRRQPAQGRGAQRRPDGRAPPRRLTSRGRRVPASPCRRGRVDALVAVHARPRRATRVTRKICPISASNVTSTRPVLGARGEVAVADRRDGHEARSRGSRRCCGVDLLGEEPGRLDVVDRRRRCRRTRCRSARTRRSRRGSSRARPSRGG